MVPLLISLFLIFSTHTFSQSIELIGVGEGSRIEIAKEEALSDLSQKIMVIVKSEFTSNETQKIETDNWKRQNKEEFESYKSKIISLKTDLPILSPKFQNELYYNVKNTYYIEVLLNSEDKLVYNDRLNSLYNNVSQNYSLIKKEDDSSKKVKLLIDILKDIEEYNKVRIIGIYLGVQNIKNLPVTEQQIKNEIQLYDERIDSIKKIAQKISNVLQENGYKSVYIYAPTTKNSHEITQFGNSLKGNLESITNIVASPSASKYILKGEYTVFKEHMEINYKVYDKYLNVLKGIFLIVHPKAYAKHNTIPKTIDIHPILFKDQIIDKNFKASLLSSYGTDDLSLRKGDSIKLYITMNFSGYYYIMSSCKNQSGEYSYILELDTESTDKNKFIKYYSPEQINQRVEVAEFAISEPYGIETIQLFASTTSIDSLPEVQYDPNTLLYKLNGAPIDHMRSARKRMGKKKGLVNKKRLKNQEDSKSSESILVISSFEEY
jgi:hypothetical protein